MPYPVFNKVRHVHFNDLMTNDPMTSLFITQHDRRILTAAKNDHFGIWR